MIHFTFFNFVLTILKKKGFKMVKKLCVILIFSIMIILISCDDNTITGSDDVHEYTNAEFVVSNTYIEDGKLIATGIVSNNGNENFTSPWYIEADFYKDEEFKRKLGGNNCIIRFVLEPDTETIWKIIFSSENIEESSYPDFAIKNIRAFRN